jgi:hypothetical protein
MDETAAWVESSEMLDHRIRYVWVCPGMYAPDSEVLLFPHISSPVR